MKEGGGKTDRWVLIRALWHGVKDVAEYQARALSCSTTLCVQPSTVLDRFEEQPPHSPTYTLVFPQHKHYYHIGGVGHWCTTHRAIAQGLQTSSPFWMPVRL